MSVTAPTENRIMQTEFIGTPEVPSEHSRNGYLFVLINMKYTSIIINTFDKWTCPSLSVGGVDL